MTKMKRCPCCGTNSSAGHKAHTKYYSLLERYSELAEIHGNQLGLLDATNEYLSNITLGVSSSARPNKIPSVEANGRIRGNVLLPHVPPKRLQKSWLRKRNKKTMI